MAEKELNPSPKFPTGEYPELSPNPKYEDGYVKGEHGVGQPTNPNQEPLTDKPTVIDGKVYVNGKLFVNGEEVLGGGGDTPTAPLEVANITTLTDEQINGLKAGDVVIKKTGDQRHAYKVSYKENNQGICLTYTDASVVETVSYDYVGGHWVYNSTDSTDIAAELPSTTSANEGDVLALDSNKKPKWSPVPVPSEISFLTTAPSAANTDGYLKIVVLDSEPATKYNGYLYIITGE